MIETRRRRRRQEQAPPVPTRDTAPPGSGLAPRDHASDPAVAARARAAEVSGEPAPAAPKAAMSDREASLARAKARAAEIMQHDISLDEDDKFFIPREIIPVGWEYAWRRLSVYGREEPQYQVKLAQTGWRPVPADRHPEMMPSTGGPYLTIDREGQRLMEIPEEVHKLLRQRDQRRAIEQVRVKTEQVGIAPQGQFARDNKGQPMTSVKRDYEPLMVPNA